MKIHWQFSHPHSDRLLSLLNECNIDDKEIRKHVDQNQKCKICIEYEKQTMISIPVAEN